MANSLSELELSTNSPTQLASPLTAHQQSSRLGLPDAVVVARAAGLDLSSLTQVLSLHSPQELSAVAEQVLQLVVSHFAERQELTHLANSV